MKFLDLHLQYRSIQREIDNSLRRTITQGDFIMGKDVETLEMKISSYCQTRYAVALNSGTDALHASLKAMNIGHGHEVLVPAFTYIATAEVVALAGANPVFVDIDLRTYNIDVDEIEKKITKRTKAIIPVHLYGLPAALGKIKSIAKKHKLKVIEDVAQAIGATYQKKRLGSIGNIGCLSFFPTKNLGAYGDGGMVVTDDANLANYIRRWRIHGQEKKYYTNFIGDSSRLDTLQAAILLAKLPHLDEWNRIRRKKAALYSSLLTTPCVIKPVVPSGSQHVFHQYTIRVPKYRDELQRYLTRHQIPSIVYYPIPLHFQRAFRYLHYSPGDFPQAERASKEVLSLPIYPELPENKIRLIALTINKFFRNQK